MKPFLSHILRTCFVSFLFAFWLSNHSLAESPAPICPLDNLQPKKVQSLETFKRIPVLQDGRIKPIETYAKSFLLQLSGRRSYAKEDATTWFARFLFAPRTTHKDKIFMINNPDILEAIKVPTEKRRRYSFQQLQPGLEKIRSLADTALNMEKENRSTVDNEIIRLYSNIILYIRLSGAFAYSFPHPDFSITASSVKDRLGLNKDISQFSFHNMFEISETLMQEGLRLQKNPPEAWTADEHLIAKIINAIFFWTSNYAQCPLGIIPTLSHDNEEWLSPMDTIRVNADEKPYLDELKWLRDMNIHYWNADQLSFDSTIRAFKDSVQKRLSAKEAQVINRIPHELLYNQLQLFQWAKRLYALGFFCCLLLLLMESRKLYFLTVGLVGGAGLCHLINMLLRIIILSRPPVSNLYETFIFVGLVGVGLGLIIERVNKNQLGLTVASICGLAFLLISDKFSADGDTLQMLVAVLNSNFWLSTHVISITIGYAACSVAGVMGHIYLLQLLLKPQHKTALQITYQNMVGILGFGLIMTFLGTALGGIWADQSWGRFWGWDPKENGALLIVIWCSILFHARLAKLIRPTGMAMGCVLGLIVVMWAWFGVNLLSVGLHSYGFTSGVTYALILYVVFEIIFLIVINTFLKRKTTSSDIS